MNAVEEVVICMILYFGEFFPKQNYHPHPLRSIMNHGVAAWVMG